MDDHWHHIPVLSTSENDFHEDPFDENLELTFPPLRYLPLFYDRSPTIMPNSQHGLRRESSRERVRLYRELVGHAPYRPIIKFDGTNSPKVDNFQIKLDVKHYRPDEITLKVEGKVLIITGKHYHKTKNGFESSEFQRKYDIPENVDSRTLTSNISPSGVLYIEAGAKTLNDGIEEEQNVFVSEENFKVCLDVSGYLPGEITIRVNTRELIVHGETKDELDHKHSTSTHHKQFTRRFTLPDDVDIEGLSSRYTKDSKITIDAPRDSRRNMRQIVIKEE